MDIVVSPVRPVAVRRVICAATVEWCERHRGLLAGAGYDSDFVHNGNELHARLIEDWSIDAVVLDLDLATADMVRRFDSEGPRLIAFGQAANAGFALGARDVAFVDDGDAMSLLAALERPGAVAIGLADLSDRTSARQGAIGAEAERVAAALARLARPLERTSATVAAAAVRDIIRHRRARDRFFPAEIFGDPAWDMLLDLFAARIEGNAVSVSSLCIAAAVPTTTALRWIRNLCEAGLFVREADPADARRAFIGLSDESAASMHAYFAALSAAASKL